MNLNVTFDSPLKVIVEVNQKPNGLRAVTTLTHQDSQLTVIGENMAESIQIGHIGTISVEWKDATGATVKVDGPTQWDSTDDSIITVEVASGNPQIANWHTVGLGNASILATADADLGDGVKKVTATTDFTVIPGEAVGGDTTVTDLGPGSPSSGGPQKKK